MDETPNGTESFRESVERRLREASRRNPANQVEQTAPFSGSSTMRICEREKVMRKHIAGSRQMARQANEHVVPVNPEDD
jgi:hypothetical protein